MKKCATCEKPLPEKRFQEYVPGKRRPHCIDCFNRRRREQHGRPEAPKPVEEKLDQVTEHRLKIQLRDAEARNRELAAQLSDNGEYAEIVREVLGRQRSMKAPEIKPRERKSGLLEATPLILASDWHVEERVRPESVAHRNRYDLTISKERMGRFFEAANWAINQQRQTYKITTAIAAWLGDFITNFLHDDDAEENELAPLDALLYAERNIIAGIEFWLEKQPELDWIMPMVDGNHGREPNTRRMRHATRPNHSLEVLMYAHIAQHFRNEKRIRFILPTSQFVFVDVYGRTIRALHGDVFKYGGGIGGITVPLFRALGRWEKVRHADLTIMGHWHQRYNLPDVMINGSLIGFNNYALAGGFNFEPPVQSVRMLDSKRWCSADIPLWVSERSDDLYAYNS